MVVKFFHNSKILHFLGIKSEIYHYLKHKIFLLTKLLLFEFSILVWRPSSFWSSENLLRKFQRRPIYHSLLTLNGQFLADLNKIGQYWWWLSLLQYSVWRYLFIKSKCFDSLTDSSNTSFGYSPISHLVRVRSPRIKVDSVYMQK